MIYSKGFEPGRRLNETDTGVADIISHKAFLLMCTLCQCDAACAVKSANDRPQDILRNMHHLLSVVASLLSPRLQVTRRVAEPLDKRLLIASLSDQLLL